MLTKPKVDSVQTTNTPTGEEKTTEVSSEQILENTNQRLIDLSKQSMKKIEEQSTKNLKKFKQRYLNGWLKYISPVIADIDTFFNKIPWFFLVLFAEPYSFSYFFFGVLFLWIYVFIIAKRIMGMFVLKRTLFGWGHIIAGILLVIIIAQIRALRFVINLILLLLKNWLWFSLISIFLIVVIWFIENYFSKKAENLEEEKKNEDKEWLRQQRRNTKVIPLEPELEEALNSRNSKKKIILPIF